MPAVAHNADRDRARVSISDLASNLLNTCADVEQHDMGPVFGEEFGYRPPNSAGRRGARNYANPSFALAPSHLRCLGARLMNFISLVSVCHLKGLT
jgi:hypothetical protein